MPTFNLYEGKSMSIINFGGFRILTGREVLLFQVYCYSGTMEPEVYYVNSYLCEIL